ncbi:MULTISPECIES: ATP-binding cassette domain-containing protein [Methylomonas]|uniref:Multidrug ABC transporter ATP-binding protein n=2 Tax=Methylomonas TaxID=416 RepID=A0A140E6V7_9GAMM|nr:MULTISPECIES: ATP-binding cassette domain-containing protein [Methylomonas]AMK79131.1 multidrug ABC transporter ATP-binding protein [Methylomonas denitrificans]OAH99641.1 multidrug ABC transporter ATP-binding protein [Methylomonas methanica]TCV78189.1 ABC-2 type transport system ATP-binding protein [Methylomonas methanica]
MSDSLVILDSVRKTFSHSVKPALEGVSAVLKPGQITGLVGPDGAGKTTLIRLMAGLLAPTSGSISVDHCDPIRDADQLRAFIGYMPQKFGLYEDLSVIENLELHADLRALMGEERVTTFNRLLAFTDLTRFTSRLAGKLSGGMKQKLGLACALLGRPRLLLLDEPSVGVDPISRRELWKMVHELIAKGMTVVWSTAYLDEAELCAEVILMNDGQLIFSGKPADLTQRIHDRSLQIRQITGNRRQLLARALRRPEVSDGVIQGHAVRLVLREGVDRPNLNELDAGDEAELVPVAPRFEDAFIEALGGGPGGDSVLAQSLSPVLGDEDIVVEAVALTKRFGDFTATDQVNFEVKRGEIFGLLGPNGAGKSTTFRMMCGLLTPTSGTARVMGIDLKTSGSEARQRLGYMAQKFSLYSNLTIEQNLKFFSGVYGLRGAWQKTVMAEMIEVFRLQPYLGTTPDTLPLGFKQRLALACAVMHQPAILFLDEPTSGVDPVTRREFWTHINGIVEKGVTVMVTTHFMDEAEYCDRIALVFRGKIIAAGSPDQLKEQIASPQNPDPSMEDAFISLVQQHASDVSI